MSQQNLNEALQVLSDKQAIHELVLRYCRCVDRQDFEPLASLYHADSIDDHGDMFCGSGHDYIAWLPGVLSLLKSSSHQVFNHLIEVNGDQAEGEVYCQAFHADQHDNAFVIGLRYLDKYIRTDSAWQFMHRKVVVDWQHDFSLNPSTLTQGGHREIDPSTHFFEFLNSPQKP